MYSCFVISLVALYLTVLETDSALLAYFGLTSSSYLNRVPVVSPPLYEVKSSFANCARSCMMNETCWSWYLYPSNGTTNCVRSGTNQCREPTLTFRTASSEGIIWWEKVLNFPTPCAKRTLFTSSSNILLSAAETWTPVASNMTIVMPTAVVSTDTFTTVRISVPATTAITTPSTQSTTVPSSTTSSTVPVASAQPTCTGETCSSCKQCSAIKGGIPGPAMFDIPGSIICNIWPVGAYEEQITLPCVDGEKPVFLYRKIEFNTTNVTEYVVNPEDMFLVLKSFNYSTFEIRFLAYGGYPKVSRYSVMALGSEGQLTLDNYTANDKDIIGVPVLNASFVNSSEEDPACGPFWDMSNSLIANNGTAFGAGICPGYLTAFYGKPGFYNGVWSSGISFPSYPNDKIIEILAYFW